MAKAASLKLVPQLSQSQMSDCDQSELRGPRLDRTQKLANVKQKVEEAVSLLRSLGGKYEKAAWMLEDSLSFALPEKEQGGMFAEDIYLSQGVDWASLIQAEELFEASR